MLKIALFEAYDPSRKDRVFYPLGLASLASHVKKAFRGVSVRICRDREELLSAKPSMVGISSTSPAIPFAVAMAREVKEELGIPVILGGAHISTLPESLAPLFDAGVIGEGEATFAALVDLFLKEGKLSPSSLIEREGIVFHDGSSLRKTPHRAPIADLDSLPFPERAWTGVVSQVQWLFSSRGCPARCAFCASSAIWRGYRLHSPAYVAREAGELVKRFNSPFLIFMDDLFAVSQERVEAVAAALKEVAGPSFSSTVTLRADRATESLCGALRAMGAGFVHIGIESASDRVLAKLKCGTTTAAQNQKALDVASAAGLSPVGSFIIGAPGEEEEDLEATYRFIERNLARGTMKSFSFSPLVPFPATPVWHDAKDRGLIDPLAMDWPSLDIDVRTFTGERYMLLNDRMSHDRFMYHFRRMKDLFDHVH
ncbi:MAG: radical SAM protein [Candidatus Eremiobacteraeota bacterium]|nr:radical SAM protein [Candidatus Eremiobacteraeota bacterium]